MKPGGAFQLREPNVPSESPLTTGSATERCRRLFLKVSRERSYVVENSAAILPRLLDEAGFKDIQVELRTPPSETGEDRRIAGQHLCGMMKSVRSVFVGKEEYGNLGEVQFDEMCDGAMQEVVEGRSTYWQFVLICARKEEE
jgi:hypothetical protein